MGASIRKRGPEEMVKTECFYGRLVEEWRAVEGYGGAKGMS